MAPPYLPVFYLVVPPFAVPVVLRIGVRSIYTPVPLLALLALVSGGFGLIELVQAVLPALLAAILGGSVLHLQGLANAPVPMLATTALFLICATLLSFSPRLSQVSPILSLIFIVTTLSTTILLLLVRQKTRSPVTLTLTPVLPPPRPSHVLFLEKNSEVKQPQLASFRSPSTESDLSLRHSSLQQRTLPAPSGKTDLLLILCVQLSYIIATSFCIPTALQLPAASTTLVPLFITSSDHISTSTYIFHVIDIVFRIITLLLVFTAYYNCSGLLGCRGTGPGSTSTSNGTQMTPRRPTTRLLSLPTSPTHTRLDSLILPSSPASTCISPIKLDFFKPKRKRDGLSVSSTLFSPCPKRTHLKRIPVVPTSDLEHEPEIGRRFPYEIKQMSSSPSSRTTVIATTPISLEQDVKEHSSMIDKALPFSSPTCNPALVRVATPMPIPCRQRVWFWAHSAHGPKYKRERDERDFAFDDEDCTDLKDPFASGLTRPTVVPSAYRRWAESVEVSEVRRWSEHEVYLQTLSTRGHLQSHQQRQGGMEPSKGIDATVCAST